MIFISALTFILNVKNSIVNKSMKSETILIQIIKIETKLCVTERVLFPPTTFAGAPLFTAAWRQSQMGGQYIKAFFIFHSERATS
jgi:hypothetical protein